jgi:type IV pilus assembly protein PilA
MLNRMRNKQGFTLIELLIVVAIIGILAAVAIPQFSAYRQKGYNSSAASDIKNAKTVQEAMFADFQTYGKTQVVGNFATATAVGGAGVVLAGPVSAATATVAGGLLDGPRADPTNNPPTASIAAATGLSLSNGVQLRCDDIVATAATQWASPSYSMFAKNIQGTRVYFTETEKTNIMFTQNDKESGVVLLTSIAGAAAAGLAVTTAEDLVPNAAVGNPVPYDHWASM